MFSRIFELSISLLLIFVLTADILHRFDEKIDKKLDDKLRAMEDKEN